MQLSCIGFVLYLQYKKNDMKSLVFITSVYFLFLALLPCHCNIQVVDSFHVETEQTSSSNTESDSIPDMCTPFCSCSSFHNPNFIAKNTFDLRIIDTTLTKRILIYNENPTSSYLDSLWRPPQV